VLSFVNSSLPHPSLQYFGWGRFGFSAIPLGTKKYKEGQTRRGIVNILLARTTKDIRTPAVCHHNQNLEG